MLIPHFLAHPPSVAGSGCTAVSCGVLRGYFEKRVVETDVCWGGRKVQHTISTRAKHEGNGMYVSLGWGNSCGTKNWWRRRESNPRPVTVQ